MAVRPGHVGEDRAGEISSEGGQRSVARGASQDAVPVEFLGHAARRERLARDHTWEEPSTARVGSRELRSQLGLSGKLPKEFGESWRQQDGVAAQDQVGVLVVELEVLRCQMAKTFRGRAEQQGDRATGADVHRQGSIGQAALEVPPAIVVIEQVLGLLARDGWDGQFAGESAACGPLQEVADQVAPLTDGSGDPFADVLLGEVGEGQAALVHPGQEVQGDAAAAPQVAVGRGGMAADGGALACSPEQEPVQVRAGEVGVGHRLVREFVIQPAGNMFDAAS
ncbi:hypothetical protein [Kitasatospora sp. NPDC054795]